MSSLQQVFEWVPLPGAARPPPAAAGVTAVGASQGSPRSRLCGGSSGPVTLGRMAAEKSVLALSVALATYLLNDLDESLSLSEPQHPHL